MPSYPKRRLLNLSLLLSALLFLLTSGGLHPLDAQRRRAIDPKNHPLSIAESILMFAISENDLTTFRDYFEKHPQFKKEVDAEYLLSMAVSSARPDLIRILLEHGARVNTIVPFGQTPLSIAIGNHHLDIVKLLVESGANVNQRSKYGYAPLMQALNWTSSDQAAMKTQLPMVEYLIAHGARVNDRNESGFTALMLSQGEVARYLLEHGADVHAVDWEGATPLHHAVWQSELIPLLVQHGADPEARMRDGETPLMQAIRYLRLDAVQALIEVGAKVNGRTGYGQTLLHLLCESDEHNDIRYGADPRVEMARILIAHGVEVDSRDKAGKTPIWYAQLLKREALVRFLLQEGAADVTQVTIHMDHTDLKSALKTVCAQVGAYYVFDLGEFAAAPITLSRDRAPLEECLAALLKAAGAESALRLTMMDRGIALIGYDDNYNNGGARRNPFLDRISLDLPLENLYVQLAAVGSAVDHIQLDPELKTQLAPSVKLDDAPLIQVLNTLMAHSKIPLHYLYENRILSVVPTKGPFHEELLGIGPAPKKR